MDYVNTFVNRLDKLKVIRNDEWTACCPAHADRSPSLHVKLADDGKLLVHCFAGCTTQDVTQALGLEMKDLFPANDEFNRDVYTKEKTKSKAREIAEDDWIILQLAKADAKAGKRFSERDTQRIHLALERSGLNG